MAVVVLAVASSQRTAAVGVAISVAVAIAVAAAVASTGDPPQEENKDLQNKSRGKSAAEPVASDAGDDPPQRKKRAKKGR